MNSASDKAITGLGHEPVTVIPAYAGIQRMGYPPWIPAYAGMTE